MIKGAKRLLTVEEYYFSKKLREVNLLKINGKPIINLGVGNPDLLPPDAVINSITDSFHEDGAHSYQGYKGIQALREAMVDFYRRKFQVYLSPTNEVLPLMGSKEGIMHISMTFLNNGDEVLIPNPGYPTYASVTKLLRAVPKYYNLEGGNSWLPDLEALESQDLTKVKLMWINYPHMPTGVAGTHLFYEKLIAFAKRNHILIVNDNPYSFILNDNPLSILSVEGAKDICLELNSLSKTFNMAGWRVGMILGNNTYINRILKIKSNIDSGMFYGIQKGAIEALLSPDIWYSSLNNVYKQRRKLIWELATQLNCTYSKDAKGLFVWAKLPEFVKSEDFVDKLLKNHDIFIAPGTVFGTQGEGYVRFSLCASLEDIEEAIARVS